MQKRIALALLLLAVSARAATPTKKYEVRKLAEGVYVFVWTDPLEQPIESNSVILVNDDDVVVVDSMLFPSSARLLIAEIRKLTPKPVRLLINTHWHDDHVFGNSTFREAWPGVQFVGHRNTRSDATDFAYAALPKEAERLGATIERVEKALASGKLQDGTPVDDARRKRYEEGVPLLKQAMKEAADVRPMPPDLVFDDRLTLHRGSRIIDVRFLGRGNTRGDAVVVLPNEKIVVTGDLVVYPIPFGIGSWYREWIKTLDALLELPADTFVLSHGPPQRDREFIRTLRGLLDALVTRVAAEVTAGASLEQVKKNVTLADWKEKLAGTDAAKQQAFDAFFVQPAVERTYLQEKGDPAGQTPGRLDG